MPGPDKLTAALMARDWGQAEKLLRRAASSKKADGAVLYNLGKVLLEQDRPGAALVQLRKAVARRPGHADSWYELGRTALMENDFPLALHAFTRACALAPEDMDARRSLGRVALRSGNYEAAKTAWSPLAGDAEADEALYRIAAETGDERAEDLRQALLARPAGREAALKTMMRVSKGRVPLRVPGRS
ncbi:tetratricopeptide repeat protein [Chachezhania antarctica]|uniref:tetratricopeptide repeat protein n=1 Tax=Chachezhania antarctica TaxID=2340860 RepID=UPI000EB35389|nr:tetratricopeptide repeat protein [Chachezhania antarctica]|tara:strand:- start:3686 stop:4249 length:564 start_codon:yes stop_codon:yes gene_type:complete